MSAPKANALLLSHQLGALVVSLVIFVGVWFVSALLFLVLDDLLGYDGDWWRARGHEVCNPLFGGYIGVSVALSWFERSTERFVFFGFAAVVLLLTGAYLGWVGAVRSEVETGISLGQMLWEAAILAAGVIGAWMAAFGK